MNPLSDPALQQTVTGVFRLAVPEITLLATACLLFLLGCFLNRRWLAFVVSLLGVIAASVLAGVIKTEMPPMIAVATIIPDGTAEFVRWVVLISVAVLLFLSWAEVEDSFATEYYGCLLVATAGVSLVGRANDLITLFLALELISIPTYVLLYLPTRSRLNQEAAAKYFLLSVMASGVLLFGFSYLYGLTGSTNLTVIIDALQKAKVEALSPLALVAIVMVILALGFRITLFPFHFYAPDVYEGGPPGVVAQLAFFPKVAGFAALIRVLGLVGPLDWIDPRQIPFDTSTLIPLMLWILAIVTMTLGNVLALLQDNVRRMLAYSSIAHGGYMLMGVIVACTLPEAEGTAMVNSMGAIVGTVGPFVGGVEALLVYLAAYGMMTLGSFAVILYLSSPERPVDAIDDLAGLGQSHPLSAAAMTIFMLSLIGIPLTAGFVGKLLIFVGAMTAPSNTDGMGNLYRILAVVAAINAAIGAYYYLRIVGVMYLRSPLRPLGRSRAVPTLLAAVALAGGTLFFGIYPQPLVKAARHAAPIPKLPAPTAPQSP